MADPNIITLGRFSSQMLTYLGVQKTVKSVDNNPTNTFKYAAGYVAAPSAGSVSQADLGGGVQGSYSPDVYNTTRCFFLSRGASQVYADTVTALVIDTATMLGVSPQSLLEEAERNGKFEFTDVAYRGLNSLRNPGNQLGVVTTPTNNSSILYRQVRS